MHTNIVTDYKHEKCCELCSGRSASSIVFFPWSSSVLISVSDLEQDTICHFFTAIFSTFDGPETQNRERWCRCTESVEQQQLPPKGTKSFSYSCQQILEREGEAEVEYFLFLHAH